MTKTATEIRKLDGFKGNARLYQLSEPIGYDCDWYTEKPQSQTSYVVVSATVVMFSGPEAFIFPANEDGEILDWIELQGSYQGALDHERALNNAGYTLSGSDQ